MSSFFQASRSTGHALVAGFVLILCAVFCFSRYVLFDREARSFAAEAADARGQGGTSVLDPSTMLLAENQQRLAGRWFIAGGFVLAPGALLFLVLPRLLTAGKWEQAGDRESAGWATTMYRGLGLIGYWYLLLGGLLAPGRVADGIAYSFWDEFRLPILGALCLGAFFQIALCVHWGRMVCWLLSIVMAGLVICCVYQSATKVAVLNSVGLPSALGWGWLALALGILFSAVAVNGVPASAGSGKSS
jgi:hypothetical protein